MGKRTLPVVFLVDVDDTLLENDRIQDDLREHLEREFGAACRDRYWKILEALFEELGYRDYLGALMTVSTPGAAGFPRVRERMSLLDGADRGNEKVSDGLRHRLDSAFST